ncbi:glycosyltransferase [Ideonella sp. BN130291]|uniref:glycosyltransferase n=1 Tax=Ideonella sp. BN130291 TaxID=3112940 RepID=UPI002E255561|nr:glycosyltransferase [Ideonella sp. BN130291]
MKILQVCKFYPPVPGGMETVAWEITEGLRRRGIDVAVLCAGLERHTYEERAVSGYRIVRAGAWTRVLSTSVAPAMPGLLRSMSRSADIVHVHMPDPMAALSLWLARPQGRVVVHWHSDVVRQKRALQLYRPLQSWVLRRADAIVATSNAYAETSPWLQAWTNKTVVIPIGISAAPSPDPEAVERIRKRFGHRKIVFSLGRMTYYKGFDVLLRAATALPDDCVIIIGGGGELLASYREAAMSRGLADKVSFVGYIASQDLSSYFAAAEVFCLPSTERAEAYGVALLEAMAMSKPVITTDIPGSAVPWVNQSGVTGLTVPVGDAQALACAIGRLVGDSAYASQLGNQARQRFEEHLTAEVMLERTTALYSRLGHCF